VEDHLRARRLDDGGERVRIADVRALQRRARRQRAGDVGLLAAGQVVDHDDLVAARDERVDEVRSDEACTAGDEHPHCGRECSAAPRGSLGGAPSGTLVLRPGDRG